MFDRLDQLEARYEDLGKQMSDPTLVNDQKKFQSIAKQHRDMEPTVEKFREYRKIKEGIAEAKAMLAETIPTSAPWPRRSLAPWSPGSRRSRRSSRFCCCPRIPNDEKNVILEIRAGTGGDEATLFAAEVFRMYLRFAEQHNWKVEVLSQTETGIGRLEGRYRHYRRRQRLLAAQVRVRRASRAARTGDRDAGPRPHLGHHGRCAAGGRRGRYQDRSEGSAHRHVLLVRTRRPVGEHDLLGGAHHASADQHGGELPGRKVADQESRKGDARAARAAVRGRGGAHPPAAGARTASSRSARATAARRSAPTTSRRTALPTTASA